MRVVRGCTENTLTVTMHCLLGLGMRHKVGQVKGYLTVGPQHRSLPPHKSLAVVKGYRIKRGSSWMDEAETSLKFCVYCGVYSKRGGVDSSEG